MPAISGHRLARRVVEDNPFLVDLGTQFARGLADVTAPAVNIFPVNLMENITGLNVPTTGEEMAEHIPFVATEPPQSNLEQGARLAGMTASLMPPFGGAARLAGSASASARLRRAWQAYMDEITKLRPRSPRTSSQLADSLQDPRLLGEVFRRQPAATTAGASTLGFTLGASGVLEHKSDDDFQQIAALPLDKAAERTQRLLQRVKQDRDGSELANLKNGFTRYLLSRARRGDRLSGLHLRRAINQPTVQQIMQQVLNSDEQQRLNTVMRQLIQQDRGQKKTALSRLIGRHQSPGARRRFEMLRAEGISDPEALLLTDAIRDPQLFQVINQDLNNEGRLPAQTIMTLNDWASELINSIAKTDALGDFQTGR